MHPSGAPARADRAQSLAAVGRLVKSLAHARSRDEVVDRLLDGVGRLRLDGLVFSVEGDGARAIGARLPAASGERSPVGILLPIDGVAALRIPVRHRAAYTGQVDASGLRSAAGLLERALSSSEAPDLVPLISVPIEVGDDLLGVCWVFGPELDAGLLAEIELITLAAGMSWSRFVEPGPGFSVRTAPPVLSDAAAAAEVRDILNGGSIAAALQPVLLGRTRAVLGYEALCRFTPTELVRTTTGLFEAALAAGLAEELDGACIAAGLSEAPRVAPGLLFVNLTLRTLLAEDAVPSLVAAASLAGAPIPAVVLEFSEHEPILDLPRLRRTAAELRAAGFHIAVDDAGAGHSSMLAIAELRPDFVKVDRDLIHGIDRDQARRALVVALLSFAGHIGARLIAEGVENDDEAQTLQALGVSYLQGDWAGSPVIVEPPPGVRAARVVDAGWFAEQEQAPFLDLPGTVAPGVSHDEFAVAGTGDVPPLLAEIAVSILRMLPADLVVVCEAALEENLFHARVAAGAYATEAVAQTFPIQAGVTGQVFASGRPVLIDDASLHPRSGQISGHPVGAESMIVVPLVAGGRRLGTLNCVRYQTGVYTDAHLQALTAMAVVVAGLLARAPAEPATPPA